MSGERRIGGWLDRDGAHFRVWAPNASRVSIVVEGDAEHSLAPEERGYHGGVVAGLAEGARYRYRLDGRDPLPDPASRFQPDGVHGPSEIVDPTGYEWHDEAWPGLDLARLVIYELHIGTWTAQGTFTAASERLPALAELGVTAVQLMPVADFPGDRNWGYDGVSLFAPARCYGRPEDLRAFVDHAHALGLGVIFDVVYNHFGPDGAYHGQFSRYYFNERAHTLWGAGINLDGPGSSEVREFFVQSALCWLREYHADGFRLDATAALRDEGPRHFLAEYAARLHGAAVTPRPPVLIAEDHRNLARLLEPEERGGYGFDGMITDDFHHEMRRLIAGDSEGYYQDFGGTTAGLATTLNQGWAYTGQSSRYWGEPRGTDPQGVALPRLVHCIQNHDQIGNRPFGDRLPQTAGIASTRAATAVLLCSAATPMLFMGEEWAASTPFQFFTDHHLELGHAVTEGRRAEFATWPAFRDPALTERIPDPQVRSTFEASTLRWEERDNEPHASMLRMHQALLALRAREPALQWGEGAHQRASALDADTLALLRERDGHAVLLLAHLRGGASEVAVPADLAGTLAVDGWEPLFSTEDEAFAPDAQPIEVETGAAGLRCRFQRPGALLVRARPGQPSL